MAISMTLASGERYILDHAGYVLALPDGSPLPDSERWRVQWFKRRSNGRFIHIEDVLNGAALGKGWVAAEWYHNFDNPDDPPARSFTGQNAVCLRRIPD